MDRFQQVEKDLMEGLTTIAYNSEVKIQAIVSEGKGHIIGMDGGVVNTTTFYDNIPTAKEYLKAFLNMHMYNNNLHTALKEMN